MIESELNWKSVVLIRFHILIDELSLLGYNKKANLSPPLQYYLVLAGVSTLSSLYVQLVCSMIIVVMDFAVQVLRPSTVIDLHMYSSGLHHVSSSVLSSCRLRHVSPV